MTTRHMVEASSTPPRGDRFLAARWLVDRHPHLARLLARVPGFLDADGDPDVDLLAETLSEFEQYVCAWQVYEQRCPPPRDEAQCELWERAGPVTSSLVSCISAMTASERARMRMLAMFSTQRVPVSVADFTSFDGNGQVLLTDWTVAVRSTA